MKISLNKNRFNVNPDFFLRRAGYAQIQSYHTGKTSYSRRFSRDHYPRFHIYFQIEADKIIFDLHLDQKQVSYEGADHAHNAEHDGPVVETEIDRLKNLLREMAELGIDNRGADSPKEDWEKQLSEELKHDGSRAPKSGDYRKDQPLPEEKKSFFKKMLGL